MIGLQNNCDKYFTSDHTRSLLKIKKYLFMFYCEEIKKGDFDQDLRKLIIKSFPNFARELSPFH